MSKQYPAKKAKLTPTEGITKDLADLPSGSAVLQCILSGDAFTVRSVLIGSQEMDPLNPAHRFMHHLFGLIPSIMEAVNGGQFAAPVDEHDIALQIGGDPSAIEKAVKQAAEEAGAFDAGLMQGIGKEAKPSAQADPFPETSGESSEPDALESEQSSEGVAVYSSENCVFQYCPHPDMCKTAPNGCTQAEFQNTP